MNKLKEVKNNIGFTLAEMLIVVAIIGILIAIATTKISTSLERAREATDFSNIRNGCTELINAAELGDLKPYIRVFKNNGIPYCYCLYIKTSQKKDGWQTTNIEKNNGGYVKMNDFYLTAPRALSSTASYNTYQIKYYIDEQSTSLDAANPTPYHFRVVVIKEESVGSNPYYVD